MTSAPGPISPTSTQVTAGLYTETFIPGGPAGPAGANAPAGPNVPAGPVGSNPPRGVVLVTHGYAEHCGRYREVANVLVQAGWAVLTYDVRGHGQSPGPRGYIDRFSIYLDDFAAMLDAAKKLAPDAPLVALGHSHGSLITLRALAGDRPALSAPIAAAIVSSPFLALKLAVPGYQKLLAKVASAIAPRLSQPNALRVEDLTSDKGKQAERLADKLCFDIATSRWFTEASAAQDHVLANAARIQKPTTWLVGHDDPIADPARSQLVASRVAGAQYHDLLGMKHEVFNEVDRAQVFGKLVAALDAVRAK